MFKFLLVNVVIIVATNSFAVAGRIATAADKEVCQALVTGEEVYVMGISESPRHGIPSQTLNFFEPKVKVLKSSKLDETESSEEIIVGTYLESEPTKVSAKKVLKSEIAKKYGCINGICVGDQVEYYGVHRLVVGVNRCLMSYWARAYQSHEINLIQISAAMKPMRHIISYSAEYDAKFRRDTNQ